METNVPNHNLERNRPGSLAKFPYSQITSDIEVQILPQYLPRQSRPDQSIYSWVYTIQITNQGSRRVQLVGRQWVIVDGNGKRDDVIGQGVIGEQPIILPQTSFTYSSGCPLKTPTGSMRGWFEFIDLDTRQKFFVRIPVFFLHLKLESYH
jgi:ApaG protein